MSTYFRKNIYQFAVFCTGTFQLYFVHFFLCFHSLSAKALYLLLFSAPVSV